VDAPVLIDIGECVDSALALAQSRLPERNQGSPSDRRSCRRCAACRATWTRCFSP
jgi:hypothetical protein